MAELANLVQRLEVAVSRLEAMPSPGNVGDSDGGAVSAYVEAYDQIVSGPVANYLKRSAAIGADVQEHSIMMKNAFKLQRDLLVKASSSQKPSDTVMETILKPLVDVMKKVQNFRELNRKSEFPNHLSAVVESVPALYWVTIAPKPGPHVKDFEEAAMFYTNRVRNEFKAKDPIHVNWVTDLMSIWTELRGYIQKHHTTGLSWSKSGPIASASAAPPSAPAGCCVVPPPPSLPPMCLGESSGNDGGDNRNALLDSINQGFDITKGLKHVSDDKKTHKNPSLRTPNAPVCTAPKPFSSPAKPAVCAPAAKQPPVLVLEGKKWKVENHDGAENLLIKDTELKQVVYAYKCSKSTLKIEGKINSITIDNCKKMGLVFENVVGVVDIINSKDIKVQVIGKVPTISVNKTDGCQIYLSKDSLDCSIVSAKSSEMNILVPKDDDYIEHPVPEQFMTVWDGSKLVTTASDISG